MIVCQICIIYAYGQPCIGTLFTMDTTIPMRYPHMPDNVSRLKTSINDGTLYFADMQAFQDKKTDYTATIYALSLSDYRQFEIKLSLPRGTHRTDYFASTCWLNDMNFYHDKAVISLQDYLVIYHKDSTEQYVYDTMYEHSRAIQTYMYKNELYYLTEDHDKGYKWFHHNSASGKEELIGELPYEAPHVVQANPNRYLFHNENYLFFLSTRYPVLHKYTLDGHWIEDIRYDFPDWHPFEDEYVRKSLDVPYGVERIYATMQDIFHYSYPKVVFPISNTYLLYYTQYDTLTKMSNLQYAILDSTGHTLQYRIDDNDTTAYNDIHFPFHLFDPIADKACISWNDLLIDIAEESEVSYIGKTPDNYQKAEEVYFKQHEPTLKFRILRYKNNDSVTMPFLYDTEHHLTSLANLSYGKSILLINNELECSACRNHLLQQLSTLNTENTRICIVYPFIPGALQEREIAKDIRRYLTQPFSMYYLATDRITTYPRFISSEHITYPAILFYESGKAPFLFSSDDIFVDNVNSFDFRPSFQKVWDEYHSK